MRCLVVVVFVDDDDVLGGVLLVGSRIEKEKLERTIVHRDCFTRLWSFGNAEQQMR